MEIKNIKLKNFTVHKTAEFSLPEQGIVFVSGENGAGKTSIVEAVAYGLWGKTLRGTPTWSAESKTECSVETYSGVTSLRTRKGNAEKVKLLIDSTDFTKDTKTKTQAVIEERCSSFDLWRKSHVFSREDSSYFACATDQERKKILETVLQLDKFDSALKKCKADVSQSEEALKEVENKIYRLSVDIEAKEIIKSSIESSKPAPYSGPSAERLEELTQQLGSEKKAYKEAQEELRKKETLLTELRVKAKSLSQRKSFLEGGSCDRCEQEIHESFRQEKVGELEKILKQIIEEGKAVALEKEKLQEKLEAAAERGKGLREKIEGIEKAVAIHKTLEDSYEESRKRAESLVEELETYRKDLRTSVEAKQKLEEEIRYLSTCKKVLGTKGVRSHIFSSLLGAVEELANSWLSAIDATFTIELASYTANKTGGTRDAIDIRVNGLGHPHGYKGCSSGERRRINIALLLALGEVARGMISTNSRAGGGTIFFDEAFAGLDMKGKELVTHSLTELAKDRCVVIIEHEWSALNEIKPEMEIILKRKQQ
jgi:DNA repair exonuclease SbcCD ATPase subunit